MRDWRSLTVYIYISDISLTERLLWSSALATGLQTGSSSSSGYKFPPQSHPCPAPPGPEAQQCAAGQLSQCQGEHQAIIRRISSLVAKCFNNT